MNDPAVGMLARVLKIAERPVCRHVRQKFSPFHRVDTGDFDFLPGLARDGLLGHAGNFRESAGEIGISAVRIHLPEPIGRCLGKVLQSLLAFVQDLIDAALDRRQVFEGQDDRAGFAPAFDDEFLLSLRYLVDELGEILSCLCSGDRFHERPPSCPRNAKPRFQARNVQNED